MIVLKVFCTLRVSVSSSGEGSTTSGSGDPRDQVGLLGDVVLDPHPLGSLDEHPCGPVGHLDHPGDHAHDPDVVELVGARLVRLGVPEATITCVRSPDRTSSTSLMERGWPTASGVRVSGKVTVALSGSTGKA